jgi:hypothetical protein
MELHYKPKIKITTWRVEKLSRQNNQGALARRMELSVVVANKVAKWTIIFGTFFPHKLELD